MNTCKKRLVKGQSFAVEVQPVNNSRFPQMYDFSAARANMVDSQIHTAGIAMPGILQAFESVPREKFVPASMRSVAYNDENLSLGDGRFLLEPATHARMIQAINPVANDVVLDIGGATGYSAAILSSMVQTVIALEEKKKYVDEVAQLCNELGICNVVALKGGLTKGNAENAPFSLIFMNGSVGEIPESLVNQLAPRGRLIAIVKRSGEVVGQVTLVQSLGENRISWYTLFEAGCPYLPGFEPKTTFTF
jgi:protein-L-isoaspartate(D-aspartate) O-methyltransferase